MKIAFILSTCAKSGPFIVARDIINNIHNKVECIDIYYLKESDQKMDFKARLFKVHLLSKTSLLKYDIIHSHGFLGDLYAFLNRKSISGKWLSTMHQEIEPDYSMRYNALIGICLEKVWTYLVSKSNCIIVLSKSMVVYYKRKGILNSTPLMFIYNGISPQLDHSTDHHNEIYKISQLKLKYSSLGISANLTYRKGIDKAIESLALPDARNLCLIVIGDGEKRKELIELATKINVKDRVLFLGYKPNAINYFKYFDLYLMCSRSEAFGLCVIEAASQKIPVICNDLPIYQELFNEDEVVRFNLNNLSSLVESAKMALAKKDILSEQLHKKYTNSFSSEIMAENYLRLYHDIQKQ